MMILELKVSNSPFQSTMEASRPSLWLLLLLNQLLLFPTESNQMVSNGSSASPTGFSLNTTTDYPLPPQPDTNDTLGTCLIDTEMGLIAMGSAGGLIVCLLVTTVVLACQVCHLQRRVYAPRTSRSNVDLVSSTGYWDADRAEVGGLVGPCDDSVMLEEVGAESRTEERLAEIREARKEAGADYEEGAIALLSDPDEGAGRGPADRDSCLVVPRDVEDMPLVV